MDHLPRLRALRRTDAEAVLSAFASDPEMQRQGTVTDLGEAQSYVERLLGSGSTSRAVVIADAADNAVGLIGLDLDDRNRNGWFWYWMHTSHRGNGWTAFTAASVANRALDEWGLERLELGHRANNPASARVARAAGFVQEGLERAKFLVCGERIDVLTYGRLRTDAWPENPDLTWDSEDA